MTSNLAYLEFGRWVHIGDGNAIRCHEGALRFGDKVVLGSNNVINAYLDIEIGAKTLIADWCYICDFDHNTEHIDSAIKDQGIVKGPVRIGPDNWLATKVTVLKNTITGTGCVVGANAVLKGVFSDYDVAVGIPAKVVKNRKAVWVATASVRAEKARALADIEIKKNK